MDAPKSAGLRQRGPEVVVSALLVAIATMVIIDSIRVGTGWADDGPRSGYFPFYIGLILLIAAGSVLVRALLGWHRSREVFAEREQLVGVVQVAVPMVVYIGTIAGLGVYVASAGLIGYFMRRHGRFAWHVTALVAAGVPLLFFMVFERWFLVPLPKGPLERLLGF